MASFPKFPQGIARPFPEQPARSTASGEDDPTLSPETFIHRDQVAQKGRGAVTNLRGRYESVAREEFDDGWQSVRFAEARPEAGEGMEEDEPPRLKTIVTEEDARSVITRNSSPDLPFSLSLNPYRGCEHGCIYCFARPTHSYLNLSPGIDFEARIVAKVNAAERLREALGQRAYEPLMLNLGSATDAYQPAERRLRITPRV